MKLLFWLLVSFAPGLLGSRFKPGSWYRSLPKPPWTPPDIAFPIVWTTLYFLIGIAAWRAFRDGISDHRGALALFLAQLVLNGLWSWIFFGRHQVGWALAELSLLFVLVLATVSAFWKISALAGGLLLPYLLWLAVALSLNGFIWVKMVKRP